MYHHVGSSTETSTLNVSPETFERQMEFLKVHHYNVVPLLDLFEMLRENKRIPMNTVAITFDDGNLDNFKLAFPVLKKMRLKATIFMITDNIGKEGWMAEEDLKILEASGISIGSHTVHHAFLPNLTKEEIRAELRDSRNKLEKILGHPVFLLSYPSGGFTRQAQAIAKDAGYQGAVTTNYGRGHYDLFGLHRIKVTNEGRSLFRFWIKTSGFYHLGKKRLPVREE